MLINNDNRNGNSSKYHRHSLRIKNYNYSIPGAYFITICTYLKENLLGYISDGKIELNVLGKITAREWLKTFQIRKNIQLDEYVIMPNHFHGIIIVLTDNNGHNSLCPYKNNQINVTRRGTMHRAHHYESFGKPIPGSIPTIVRLFKSAVTREIKRLDYPFLYSIWQRNYYEHIIRNENELNRIREYIQNNPLRWEYDRENCEGKPDQIENIFWKNFI
jgi:REP element-mobilizing transposase RayT